MATWCEIESEESSCSYKSLDDEEKAIAFVTSVEEVSPRDGELVLDDYEDLPMRSCVLSMNLCCTSG